MPIPDFQSIMRPLLEHLTDGEIKANRVAWAKAHLKGAGLIDSPGLMVDSGVGVSKIATYEINRLDSDYFEE